jgi:nucleoside-diphosphate-sugar epimerase
MNDGTVLVTGANGFLGKTILTHLVSANVPVRATDVGGVSTVAGVAYQRADITRLGELTGVVGSAATLIHAAGLAHVFTPGARPDEDFRQINEIGTENITRVAAQAGARHLILISSVSVYGAATPGICDENAPCHPIGIYARSKYHAERRAIEIANKSGIALTILRLATLYGEGDPGNVRRLIRALDRGRFFWIGDGGNRKSLLYKEDAARACLAVVARPANGVSVYNVAAPTCTMREIVEGLALALGKRPWPGRIPVSMAGFVFSALSCIPSKDLSRLQATLEKWLADDVYDGRRFERNFSFRSQVPLGEGLRREVVWYRQQRRCSIPCGGLGGGP